MHETHALCMPYIFSVFLLLDLSYPITEYHMDIICLCNIMQRQRVHAGNSCTVHALHFFFLSFVGLIISHNRISYGYHMFMQYNAEAKGLCRQLMHADIFSFFLLAKCPCRQLMHCACLTFFLSFFCWTYHIP